MYGDDAGEFHRLALKEVPKCQSNLEEISQLNLVVFELRALGQSHNKNWRWLTEIGLA